MLVLFLFPLFLCYHQKHWILLQPVRDNPYRLLYQVTNWQHKVLARHRTFTYCKNNAPSGLNLAKHKYGGTYFTEQVEDVKAFYDISKKNFALGPIYFAIDLNLYQFTKHGREFSIIDSNTSSLEF